MRPSAIRSLACGLSVLLAATALPGAATVSAQGRSVIPAPALQPAIATGHTTGIAFAGDNGHGSIHVHATVPVAGDTVELGPALPGEDGAPALAAMPDGGLVVLASRRGGAGRLIWSQRFDGRRWGPAQILPATQPESHHPALGTGGGRVWAVWVSGNGEGDPERLLAAPWLGDTWGAPELLPSAPGTPGAPAIAVDPEGLPAVVWAARDAGADTEIWLVRRHQAGWASPLRMTDNEVPDISPGAGFAGRTLITAWASFSPDGYRVEATSVGGTGRGPGPQRISREPGTAPRVVGGRRGARVVWSTPWSSDPTLTEMRSAAWRGDRFGREVAVVRTRNARTAVTPGPRREWLAAWHDGAGVTAASVAPTRRGAPRVRLLQQGARPGERAAFEIQFPGSYLAFGDSITAGIVRYDGVVTIVDGYPVHLGRMISELVGQTVIVTERAVPGEETPEGFNRLRATLISEPRKVVMINEGANDLANLQDPHTVFQTLLAMTAAVRERNALPLLSTITPRNEGGFSGGVNRRIDETNAMIRSQARGGALIVDLHAAFYRNGRMYSDHIHPNASGYVLMAEVWFRSLLPVLNSLIQSRDVERAIDDAAAQALKPGSRDRIQ